MIAWPCLDAPRYHALYTSTWPSVTLSHHLRGASYGYTTSSRRGILTTTLPTLSLQGRCSEMCPSEEVHERLHIAPNANLQETDPLTGEPDAAWLVTMFHRNDAGELS